MPAKVDPRKRATIRVAMFCGAMVLVDENDVILPGQAGMTISTSRGEDGNVETLLTVTYQAGPELTIEMVE